MNFYLKSEPAGEICVGTLSKDNIKELKKLYKTENMNNSVFIQESFTFNDICSLYGIFTNLKKDLDFKTPYNQVKEYELPSSEDEKFYLIYLAFDKYSLEFDFELDEEFDEKKVSIDYASCNFKKIKHAYGQLTDNVITSIKYDGKDIEDFFDAELIGHGDIMTERHILHVKGDKSSIVYSNRDGEETWGKFLKYLHSTHKCNI